MNPIVSVIVPVYNTDKYLDKCFLSILGQTYRNLEIIIINDGSTDNSGKLCDEYSKKDKRIKVIHQNNRGASAARNAGLDLSTGKYIQFVDSDDFINKEMTSVLVENIESDKSEWVICSCNIIYIDRVVKKITNLNGQKCKEEILPLFYDLLRDSFISSLWNKLYLNFLIKATKIKFDENLLIGEDGAFNFEYFRYINYITFINICLYNYNQSNHPSLMSNYKDGFVDYFFNRRKFIRDELTYFNLFNINKDKFYYDYANQLNDVFYNLFHEGNMMSKRQILSEIKSIIEKDEMSEVLPYFNKSNIRTKVIGIFIRFKLVYFIYYFYYLYAKIRYFYIICRQKGSL